MAKRQSSWSMDAPLSEVASVIAATLARMEAAHPEGLPKPGSGPFIAIVAETVAMMRREAKA